jgi:hypothetical protein
VRSHRFRVASEADLLRLKRIARARRSVPGDVEDLAFLEARRQRNGPSRERARIGLSKDMAGHATDNHREGHEPAGA